MKVDVDVKVVPETSVTCHIRAGHAKASVKFADGEITMTVPTDSGDIEISVPIPAEPVRG